MTRKVLVSSLLVIVLQASPQAASAVPESTAGFTSTQKGGEVTAVAGSGYSAPTPQSSGSEQVGFSPSLASGKDSPPEPSPSYIDNICGMVLDDRVRVRDPIFSNEISGCLLGFRPEQVTQAPQGRGSRAPQPPGPGRIIDRVIELVAAPELDIAPSDIGLTGLETYVWIDEPAPVSVSAAAGGTTVDARAFPSQYLWDWGDGNDTLTYDSGRPWSRNRPGSIEHVYETRGRYDLSVEVVWEAQWRINGGAWQALGFFSLGDSVDYPVRQIQARLTRTNN
jgi:hypothetical protein